MFLICKYQTGSITQKLQSSKRIKKIADYILK